MINHSHPFQRPKKSHTNHPFHLVMKSPWPVLASCGAMLLTAGLVKWFHTFTLSLLLVGLLSVGMSAKRWWRDVTYEASKTGAHTFAVVTGMRWGMLLFIVSEVFFFFSFFWAFFHSSLNPTMEIGGCWPPSSIAPFNSLQTPLLNTTILLASGVTVTWAHHATLRASLSQTKYGLNMTILLGMYFTSLQAMEYWEASFSIADSVYGSTFFVATGFHGLHVIIGTVLLIVAKKRLKKGHFNPYHHVGLEVAIWYWHFVDVVWLLLYTSIYWWGA